MNNLTFNNQVFTIYSTNENKSMGILTLNFSMTDYTFDVIKNYFDNVDKEKLKRIIKTSNTTYITTFNNYTNVRSIGIKKLDVPIEKRNEILVLNESGQEVITSIPTNEITQIDVIEVILEYEDPTKVIVEKLNQQINPTIDVSTCTLDELKKYTQKRNSDALELFLINNPLLYTDGKYYGVSKIDREEMAQQYLVYQSSKIINPNLDDTVKWHSKGAKCVSMSVTDFANLVLAVFAFTEPYYEKMQTIKESIFAANSKDELMNIEIFNAN